MDKFEINLNDLNNLNKNEKEILIALLNKANQPKENYWQPKCNEEYYFIDDERQICHTVHDGLGADFARIEIGNCYRTLNAAIFDIKRKSIIQTMKKISKNYHPVQDSFKGEYYCLKYDIGRQKVCIQNCTGAEEYFEDIYFNSKELAQKAIDVINECILKKYYFKVEL